MIMVTTVILWLPWGHTPDNKAYNQLTYYAKGMRQKVWGIKTRENYGYNYFHDNLCHHALLLVTMIASLMQNIGSRSDS